MNIRFNDAVRSYLDVYVKSMFDTFDERNCDYDDRELDTCFRDDLVNAYIRTSHVVKATAVAWGACSCSFAARLMVAIGAKKISNENLPGKGNNVHKLLSIASIKYLNEWRRGGSISESALDGIINQSIKELDDLLQVRDENDLNDIKNRAKRMLKNLVEILPKALQSLGVTYKYYDNLRFYAENEMIDYRSHIWGVPDLIIEHPGLRKAIIVEWKSDEGSPLETEKCQAYIYAMLEAIRLGHGETFNDLIEAIAPSNVEDTKVLPIIIRPNYAYSDHPLFPVAGKGIKPISIDELRERIRRIVVAATHLTLLIMDIDTLRFGSKAKDVEKTRDRCVVTCKNRPKPDYVFRYTPSTLPRGNPMNQRDESGDYKYPCILCPFSDKNSKLQECRFYFGSYEKDELGRLLWLYRFKVYRERDRDMVVYRVLYELADYVNALPGFEQYLYSGKHAGFRVNLDKGLIERTTIRRVEKMNNYSSLCGAINISFGNLNVMKKVRMGVYSIDSKYSIYEGLVLRRKLMLCENLSGEMPRISLPRLRQPVLVTLIEGHVKYPTLGISLFGRVEKTLLPGEEDEDIGVKCGNDEVCVVVTPISPYLRLPFKIFNHYINEYGLNRALVVEADADLTNMDLATLHALHMSLKNISEEEDEVKREFSNLTTKDRERILESVEEAFVEAFNAYTRGEVS